VLDGNPDWSSGEPVVEAMEYIWVGVGGFVGANARYIVGRFAAHRFGDAFPVATLIVNLTGSFAIGLLLTLLLDRWVAHPAWRLLLAVGFLGGYTTFSSYTYETLLLIEKGGWTRAVVYSAGSVLLGLGACAAGIAIGRLISH